MRVRHPRDLADLAFAHRLERFGGVLARDGTHECRHFDACLFEGTDAGGSTFWESAFTSVTFHQGRYRRCRFDDVWLGTVRVVGSDFAETSWLDVEFVSAAIAGTDLYGAQLRRVVFHGCKLDQVNARGAALRDVAFVDCLLRDVDLAGARLNGVTFAGSSLERVRLDNASTTRVDLRYASGVGTLSGVEALRGATIGPDQLPELAPALAHAAGIVVRED